MWMGSDQYRLAPALVELIHQLEAAFPAQAWQVSPQTGTIGDAAHLAEGSASDHNPWIANTVRAVDVAADTPGGPDAEALFQMVNRMFADRDGRVWPNGYAIFNGRITDWNNPGGYHAQTGDPHLQHVHISVSQNPSGYDSTAPWQLGESVDSGSSTPITIPEDGMFEIIHDTSEPLVGYYAWSLGAWRLISGSVQLKMAQQSGLSVHGDKIRAVTHVERLRIQNLALGH